MLEVRKRKTDRNIKEKSKPASPSRNSLEKGGFQTPNEDNIMTRKPIRIRRQRIPVLQSGYCAICNLPYNSIEDHVQSKKHQKLIGEDANYIALNGYIHSDVGIESLLSLTGIDAIGLDDFSPKIKRRNMPRTRSSSLVSDVKTPQRDTGHQLRSKKNVNYATPPLDDDSFEETPETDSVRLQEKLEIEPVRLQYKEYRELRSSTRALAKLTSCSTKDTPEVWESGRPKRACILRQKRISSDERLSNDNKAFYKVEVLPNKSKSNDKDKVSIKPKEPAKLSETDKGLIVKFKKLRATELVQLNNEATNFLFPPKADSSDDDDDDDDERDETENTTEAEDSSVQTELNEVSSISDVDNDAKPPDKFKVDDEASTDSISSEGKAKRKRRSHAEAFIMDNQKYYKFETPGSSSHRLRYHGSYLSPIPTKCNGGLAKNEPKVERPEEKKDEEANKSRFKLSELTFSFETVPENEKWYQTFRRQDRVEQRYCFSNNYYWNDFVLPHQIPHLRPLDPRTCYHAYKDLKKCICDSLAGSKSREPSPETVPEESKPEKPPSEEKIEQTTDEESKDSTDSCAIAGTGKEPKESSGSTRSSKRLTEALTLSPTTSRARNSRKSPRQHASTLAILSSLVNQRRKRSSNGFEGYVTTLPTIQEEPTASTSSARKKPPTPQRQRKPKVDYIALAAKIDEELNTALDFDVDLEPTTDPDVSFFDQRWSLNDLMSLNELKTKEAHCKKIFNGAPHKKPIKRKKNLTGWPNKIKKKKVVKEEGSPNEEKVSEEDGEVNTDQNSITVVATALGEIDDRENKCDQDIENRVSGNESEEVVRDSILQPYVYVKKLENCVNISVKKVVAKAPHRRTVVRQRQRRILASHTKKPPRMMRRPGGGRWIRER